ncbi:MAG: SEC59/DGK1/VTE5 family protein [archaeon]|nr:SEC59/DGK1/VTE5 family protein [archaeon]
MSSPKREKYSFSTEILRKMIHLNAIYIVLIYEFFGKGIALLVLTIALIIALEIEYFRIEWGKKIPLVQVLFRQKEEKTLGGHVFLGIGAIVVISVFSKDVALLAILMTLVGDAAAAIFGRIYGKHFIPGLKNKAIEGVFAEFAADILIGIIYLTLFIGNITPMYWIILIIMSFVATMMETLCSKLDDNLLVPVFSGFAGQALIFILPVLIMTA